MRTFLARKKPLLLGKPMYYRCTNPAFGMFYIIADFLSDCKPYFVDGLVGIFVLFFPYTGGKTHKTGRMEEE